MDGSLGFVFDLIEIELPRLLKKAEQYLNEPPITVTGEQCERNAGSRNDFYSEGDYWWPNPDDPDGPYIRKDGLSNPDNFIAHRLAMMRLSDIVGTFASLYQITRKSDYAKHAVAHLKAWFIYEETKMNPSLLYGQAIKGRHTGRSIGIIDTIHLVEVALGAKHLSKSSEFAESDQHIVKDWFRIYLNWINTHPYGQTERDHPNNHGVCWSLQAAAFATLLGDSGQLAAIRQRFKSIYLGKMMDLTGGFPAELARTKPYGYSLFMIDAMAGVAQLASTQEDNLWSFKLPDGRGMQKGVEFIAPYFKEKQTWPYAKDVMYWDEWPVRHPSLLLAGLQFNNPEFLALWRKLEPDPQPYEIMRNLPMRHPILWCKI